MTNPEFSDKFTVLLDSYGTSSAFGKAAPEGRIVLNEYEKSLFLTMAQDEIVSDLYNGHNSLGESFEGNEELRRYLEPLITTRVCEVSEREDSHITPGSVFYRLPGNVAFLVYEQVTVGNGSCAKEQTRILDVVPVLHDEYERIRKNPFRGPTERRVLRIDSGKHTVELVSKYPILEYKVRYVRQPSPIILEDLSCTGVSIKGEVMESECILNPILHDHILKRAVQLAISTKASQRG